MVSLCTTDVDIACARLSVTSRLIGDRSPVLMALHIMLKQKHWLVSNKYMFVQFLIIEVEFRMATYN